MSSSCSSDCSGSSGSNCSCGGGSGGSSGSSGSRRTLDYYFCKYECYIVMLHMTREILYSFTYLIVYFFTRQNADNSTGIQIEKEQMYTDSLNVINVVCV